MVDEVGQLPAGVDGLAGDGVGPGHRSGATAEHTNFADLETPQLERGHYNIIPDLVGVIDLRHTVKPL